MKIIFTCLFIYCLFVFIINNEFMLKFQCNNFIRFFIFFFSFEKLKKRSRKARNSWLSKCLDKSITDFFFEIWTHKNCPRNSAHQCRKAMLSRRTDERFTGGDQITLANNERKKIVLNQQFPAFIRVKSFHYILCILCKACIINNNFN